MANNGNGAHPPVTQPDSQPDTADAPRRYSSVGLKQAYDFRDFAASMLIRIQEAEGDELEAEALRARALRDASSVFHDAQDEARVCRGVGKPKSVTASNDPARKANKGKRKPLEPVILPVQPDP